MRVVALAPVRVRQVRNEAVGFCPLGGRAHVSVAGIGAAVGDVVAHRAVQQRGVLGDHANLAAQAFLGDVRDVLAVDTHPAGIQIVKAQQQIDQG